MPTSVGATLSRAGHGGFFVDLFRHFTVLFVGYSHNDLIVSYLARALPESTGRAALCLDRSKRRLANAGEFSASSPLAIRNRMT
jgi:hypothetical protein